MRFLYIFTIAEFFIISFVYGKQGYGPGEQDYGYIETFEGAHMFYWLLYTTADVKNYTERPLVLWLQGGPSSTDSGNAFFKYLGPLDMDENKREYAWAKYVNVLLIDNPLGTGYSYVDDLDNLSRTNTAIAVNLVKTMQGFYKKHAEFLDKPLYVFGESYAGKMGIEFVWEMWKTSQENKSTVGKIKSFNMINPWISTEDQFTVIPKVAYKMGIADRDQRNLMEEELNSTIELMHEGAWSNASLAMVKFPKKFCQRSHGLEMFNVLKEVKKSDANNCEIGLGAAEFGLIAKMNFQVKIALKIPLLVFWSSQRLPLLKALAADILKPVIDIVNKVLNNTDIDVRIFSGNLDLVCPTAGSLNWIEKLNWSRKFEYLNASRNPYYVDDVLEGYEKTGGGLSMFWILHAGHLMIVDRPKTVADLLKKFTGVKN